MDADVTNETVQPAVEVQLSECEKLKSTDEMNSSTGDNAAPDIFPAAVHQLQTNEMYESSSSGYPLLNSDCEVTYTGSATPHLPMSAVRVSELEVVLPTWKRSGSLRLSDTVSIISGEEINQRREALKLFSSQQSMVSSIGRSMNLIPNMTINYELTPFSSTLSSLHPLCRICQCAAEPADVLITPCRCDGSLKHIHATCLLYRDWKWPKIALRDKVLHGIFTVSLITMIGCAIATVLCFITDNKEELSAYKKNEDKHLPLTMEEIITICCGVTFFLSFFISMSAEIKAKRTIYQICRKCLRHNTVWFVENYALANDPEYRTRLQSKESTHGEAIQHKDCS